MPFAITAIAPHLVTLPAKRPCAPAPNHRQNHPLPCRVASPSTQGALQAPRLAVGPPRASLATPCAAPRDVLLAQVGALWRVGAHSAAVDALLAYASRPTPPRDAMLFWYTLARCPAHKSLCYVACQQAAWPVVLALLRHLPVPPPDALLALLQNSTQSDYSADQIQTLVDLYVQLGRDSAPPKHDPIWARHRTDCRGVPRRAYTTQLRQKRYVAAQIILLAPAHSNALLDTLTAWRLARRTGQLTPARWAQCMHYLFAEPATHWLTLQQIIYSWAVGHCQRAAFLLEMARAGATRTCHLHALAQELRSLLQIRLHDTAGALLTQRFAQERRWKDDLSFWCYSAVTVRFLYFLQLHAPALVLAVCRMSVVQQDWQLLRQLLRDVILPPAGLATDLLDALQQVPEGIKLDLSLLCDAPGLSITSLSVAQLQTLVRLHLGNASPTHWGSSPLVADSFNHLLCIYDMASDAPQRSAYVLAWRAAYELRLLLLFRMFWAPAAAESAPLAPLLQVCAPRPWGGRALLLALGLQHAAGHASLLQPRLQYLATSRFLAKSNHHLQGLLHGLCTSRAPPEHVAALCLWPNDAQLQALLSTALQTARQQVAQSYAASAPPQTHFAALYSQAKDAQTRLTLHCQYVQQHGDITNHQAYQASLRVDLQCLQKQLQQALPHLAPDPPLRALQKTIKSKLHTCAREAPIRQQQLTHQLHLLTQALATQEALHNSQKPQPPTLPSGTPTPASDFFAQHQQHQVVATYYHQVICTQQIAALPQLHLLHARRQLSNLPTPLEPAPLQQHALQSLAQSTPQAAKLAALLQRFRQPELFWTFCALLQQRPPNEPLLLQQLLKNLLQGNYETARAQSPQMRALFTASPSRRALRAAWQAGAQQPSQQIPGAMWVDTADFVDMLSSADEIHGSCQSVYNDDSCQLLGRLIDGSKRLLALKSADGSLLVRAVWRLMDDAPHPPVLLLSKTYHRNDITIEPLNHELNAFAQQRATTLQLPLVTAWCGAARHSTPAAPRFPRPLSCHAAATPEYWDEVLHHSGNRRSIETSWYVSPPTPPAAP